MRFRIGLRPSAEWRPSSRTAPRPSVICLTRWSSGDAVASPNRWPGLGRDVACQFDSRWQRTKQGSVRAGRLAAALDSGLSRMSLSSRHVWRDQSYRTLGQLTWYNARRSLRGRIVTTSIRLDIQAAADRQTRKGAGLTSDPEILLAITQRLGANCVRASVAGCCNDATDNSDQRQATDDVTGRAATSGFATRGSVVLCCCERLRSRTAGSSNRQDRRRLQRDVAALHCDLCRRTARDHAITNEQRLTSACWKKLTVTCNDSALRGCGQRTDGLLGSREQRCRKARHYYGGGYPRKFHLSLP